MLLSSLPQFTPPTLQPSPLARNPSSLNSTSSSTYRQPINPIPDTPTNDGPIGGIGGIEGITGAGRRGSLTPSEGLGLGGRRGSLTPSSPSLSFTKPPGQPLSPFSTFPPQQSQSQSNTHSSPNSRHTSQFPSPGLNGPIMSWKALAATSGAPTPSTERPGFGWGGGGLEKLNLENSWSGGNITGGGGEGEVDPFSQGGQTSASGSGSGSGAGLGTPFKLNLGGRNSYSGSSTPSSSGSASAGGPSGFSGAVTSGGMGRLFAGGVSGSGLAGGRRSSLGTSSILAGEKFATPALPKALTPSASSTTTTSTSTASITTTGTSSASSSSSGSSTPPSPITPTQLATLIANTEGPAPLILDLRPPSSFNIAHIPLSHSLPIPSTLLKRQTFTIQKLAAMLPPRSLKAVRDFSERTDIVIIDQDTNNIATGSVFTGLCSKLKTAGSIINWTGKVWFLKGGISACESIEGLDLVEGSSASEGEETVNEEGNGEAAVAEKDEGDIDMDSGPTASGTVKGGSRPSAPQSSATKDSIVASGSSSQKGKDKHFVAGGRMIGGLGKLAFQQASVKGPAQRKLNAPTKLTLPTPGAQMTGLTGFAWNQSGPPPRTSVGSPTPQAGNDVISPGSGSGSGKKGSKGSREAQKALVGATSARELQPANPFFDNIRQNLELSHGGITERIPLSLSQQVVDRANELPPFLRDMVLRSDEEAATLMAGEFEAVERGEQRRLQGVMEWHSRGSRNEGVEAVYDDEDDSMTDSYGVGNKTKGFAKGLRRMGSKGVIKLDDDDNEGVDADVEDAGEQYFPFSITAGIERGGKNRYKNIWPYDFSRVRLKQKCHDDGSDYINASFVQPKGSTKRYIATQGPLDATFRDFWTLIWEQDVHVIVMLTKQTEGGSIKCGSYWTDGTYGHLRLDLLSCDGGEDEVEKSVSGFDFPSQNKTVADAPNIKRVFLLTHLDKPEVKPRKITQVQCVTWPDFDVPGQASTLLDLIKEVDSASDEMLQAADKDVTVKPPVLVHCSAGVGRTGSYIVVDAMLEGLRREHYLKTRRIRGTSLLKDKREGSASSKDTKDTSRVYLSEGSPSSNRVSTSPGAGFSLSVPSGGIARRLSAQQTALTPAVTSSPELMQVDNPLSPSSSQQDLSFRHSHADSTSSSEATAASRRPSLAERHHSSDTSTDSQVIRDQMGEVPPMTESHMKARTPSPISEMQDPVRTVLAGMRVQRMSLCQSLRQYAFVYRAIIQGYLNMLDEEQESMHDDPQHSRASTNNSAGNTDDEGHIKRRASPTELFGASLQKRPSIKIMRRNAPAAEGTSSEAQGSTLVSPPGSARSRFMKDASKSDLSLHPSGSSTSLDTKMAGLGSSSEASRMDMTD